MALRRAVRILPLALAVAVVAEVSRAPRRSGALWPEQGCAALGRCCPGRDPTCVARGPPRCFCDQACGAVRDCCPDYARVCPGAPRGRRSRGSTTRAGEGGARRRKEGSRPPRGSGRAGAREQGGLERAGHSGKEWAAEVRADKDAWVVDRGARVSGKNGKGRVES